MAGNEWINGYLEAILDAGRYNVKRRGDGKIGDGGKGGVVATEFDGNEREGSLFSPTRYFVEEVVNSFDESDLHKTWIKVIATRNTRERNNRLENMCWRIWHLARKKKQIAWDDAQRLAKRRLEREQGRSEAADDLSELSEGEKEKGDGSHSPEPAKDKIARINSDLQAWSDDEKPRQLFYIVLISMHGLVRGENMELGRDSDTGGQVKYVVELARALASTKGVYRVDLLTRQITSHEVDSSYGEPIEMLSCPADAGDGCGAYIIRIPCGPGNEYIPKESLWPHVPEFVDGALNHIVNMARVLGEQIDGKPVWPYVIHGHYADAAEAAALLSGVLNVPMVLTGHSLGRNKFEQLLKQGRLSREDINTTYKIMRRIEAEELGLDAAEMVVTSTRQEIEEQWGLYDGFDLKLERKLRVRRRRGVSCYGRYMPRMVVIPPGMDFSNVKVEDSTESESDLKSLISSDKTPNKRHLPRIWSEVMRFFSNPHKPMILALSRPDPKKNVTTLLKAFGECQHLRELANLTLILGNRDDIEEMPEGSSVVLTNVLKLIDKYNLYGQVAYPKHHKQSDVPEIYRLAAKTKGVFINPALVEPFGLTLIEAAAYGLPIVATRNGGPVDILKALNNGLLIDPHDQKAIADALLKLVADKSLWAECRKNGLKNIHCFSWTEHCHNYLSQVDHCRNRHPTSRFQIMPIPEEPLSESLRDVEDLSLKFSIDGELKANGELDLATRQKELIEALTRKVHPNGGSPSISLSSRRQKIFVIALDPYDSGGLFTNIFRVTIKNIMKVARGDLGLNRVGFVLLTGATLQETLNAFKGSDINVEEFEALSCNSGSSIYYPGRDFIADVDYEGHLEYRWPGDNVRSMVLRLAKAEDGTEDDIEELKAGCNSRCIAFSIKPGGKVRRIDDLRQALRMRGFRCHIVYSCAGTRLSVMPLFASRIQALRYLSIRWGIDFADSVVFVGDKGDTDYEQLLGGLHKTIILNGTVECGSEKLLRSAENFKRVDVVALNSPRIRIVEDGSEEDIWRALESLRMK